MISFLVILKYLLIISYNVMCLLVHSRNNNRILEYSRNYYWRELFIYFLCLSSFSHFCVISLTKLLFFKNYVTREKWFKGLFYCSSIFYYVLCEHEWYIHQTLGGIIFTVGDADATYYLCENILSGLDNTVNHVNVFETYIYKN